MAEDEASLPRMESLLRFVKRVRRLPPPKKLLGDLITEDAITLSHGQPRSSKSLAMLDCGLVMSTGSGCAFNMSRFPATEAIAVAFIIEEDSERRVYQRINALLLGRGLKAIPQNFHLWVRRGVSIDDPGWQDHMIKEANRLRLRFLALDPLRGLTSHSDQGPAELVPAVRFLRRFQVETDCKALTLIHHDTKPNPGVPARSRPQRASGGGILSVSDAPIHFEATDVRGRFLVTPEDYKFSDNPAPFFINHEFDGHKDIMTIRLVGEEAPKGATAAEADDLLLQDRILIYLRENPRSAIRAIAPSVKKNRDAVTAMLERMKAAGLVKERPGPRRARLWSVSPGVPKALQSALAAADLDLDREAERSR